MVLVLVAEEDLDHQRAMAEMVRELGYEVAVADDGWAGLVSAQRRRPDLVIADADMTHLGGVSLCRAFREDTSLTEVPFVLVTALLATDDPQLVACGAAAVLHRPVDSAGLSAVLARHAERVPAVGARSAGPSQPVEPIFVDAMLDSVEVGIAACDTDGRLTAFNGFLRDFFGEESAAVPVKEWAHRFHLRHHDGSQLVTSELPMLRALNGETVEHAGLLAADQDGRQRWLAINARPVRDANDTIAGAVAAVHDVTGEYRSRMYQSCKCEVLKALAEGPTSTAGDSVLRILATTLGWPYVRLWTVDPMLDRLRTTAAYAAAGQPPLPLPLDLARGHGLPGACWQRGDVMWVSDIHAPDSPILPEVAAIAAYRAAGAIPAHRGDQVTGVLTFFSFDPQEPDPALLLLLTGIVDSIGAYREQRRADELARSLAASTDEYIALVGHELRTPLAAIVSNIQLLAEDPDVPGDLHELLEAVGRNSHRLQHLVGELLDLAALDAGHVEFAADEVDLDTVVTSAIERVTPLASGRGIGIVRRASHRIRMIADRQRLEQMLHCLLDNALKFSPDDATVTVTSTGDVDSVTLTVADSGVGLPADERDLLFRRLYRGDNARHQGVDGNGLGLALCRGIVERCGGTITLAPNDPAGTLVTVRLPRW